MKRISLVLLTFLLLLLSGCGNSEKKWQEKIDLSNSLFSEGEYALALEALDQAHRIKPDDSFTYTQKAKIYLEMASDEDILKAYDEFRRASWSDSANAEAFLGMCEVNIRLGKYIDAVAELKAYTGDDHSVADRIYELENLHDIYDSDGVLRISVDRDSKNSDYTYCTYGYSDTGFVTHKQYYLSDGEKAGLCSYEYADGKLVKESNFDREEKLTSYFVHDYTPEDVYKKITEYSPEDVILKAVSYDEHLNVKRQYEYADGELNKVFSYEYSDKDTLLKINEYLPSGDLMSTEFYDNDIPVKKAQYTDGYMRYVHEYNSDLAVMRTEEFDSKGQILTYTLFSYENEVLKKSEMYYADGTLKEFSFFDLSVENTFTEKVYTKAGVLKARFVYETGEYYRLPSIEEQYGIEKVSEEDIPEENVLIYYHDSSDIVVSHFVNKVLSFAEVKNANNKTVRRTDYKQDGSADSDTIYEYGEQDKVSREEVYKNGYLQTVREYTDGRIVFASFYGENGLLESYEYYQIMEDSTIRADIYNSDDAFVGYSIEDTSSDGVNSKKTFYSPDGVLQRVQEYDGGGRITVIWHYYPSGALMKKEYYEYSADGKATLRK